MAHFTLEQWADFARNTLKGKTKANMQAHLNTGCERCGKVLRLWTRVREVSSREHSYAPSASTLRIVKSMRSAAAKPSKQPVLDLLFDSLLTPALAGVRSTTSTARQLLYAAGAYRIDLRMEPQLDTEKVSVMGQVLNSADPSQMIPTISVTLIRNNKAITSTQTGDFGEFQLECKLTAHLQLRLRLPDGVGVEIPLVEPAKASLTGLLDYIDNKEFMAGKSKLGRGTGKRV
ncbi:MAG TPA: hypothetical protein VJ728_16290 [Candidatus Binataceae bacterium]|nr:hypothetical protein [Candidatus Binataceae bacterium]